MSALTTVGVVRTRHVVCRLASPLLVSEAVGLLGLVTSGARRRYRSERSCAGFRCRSSLCRASWRVDTIRREELVG
jgi:hypothetical protein